VIFHSYVKLPEGNLRFHWRSLVVHQQWIWWDDWWIWWESQTWDGTLSGDHFIFASHKLHFDPARVAGCSSQHDNNSQLSWLITTFHGQRVAANITRLFVYMSILILHTYIHIYIHTYIHTCMHACMHTYIHTYTVYICIYIYIHTISISISICILEMCVYIKNIYIYRFVRDWKPTKITHL